MKRAWLTDPRAERLQSFIGAQKVPMRDFETARQVVFFASRLFELPAIEQASIDEAVNAVEALGERQRRERAHRNRDALVGKAGRKSKTGRIKASGPKPPKPTDGAGSGNGRASARIFTDGSCDPNPGPGGWAYSVWLAGREACFEKGGAPRTTNNRMEMTAVIKALEWIEANSRTGPAQIVSDSQYVVKGINAWRFKWRKNGWCRGPAEPVKNVDLWREIDRLVDKLAVTVRWQRGHVGHKGNERADRLAQKGRLENRRASTRWKPRSVRYR